MSSSKHRDLVRLLERLAAVLVLANLVLYFGVIAVLGRRIGAEQAKRDSLYQGVRNQQVRLARLEGFQSRLPEAREQLAKFEKERIPSRRQGFSKAARRVRDVAERSGIQLSGVAYKLEPAGKEPLERLGITLTADGPFTNLVRFAHELETAEDFLIVREFNFRPGESGDLALRIEADMYLAQ
jgi:Tfp pilus assembly protein PilO